MNDEVSSIIPDHKDLSDQHRATLLRGIFDTGSAGEMVDRCIADLMVEADDPERYGRTLTARLFDFVTAARGMLAASERAYALGDSSRAKNLSDLVDVFLQYSVAEIAELDLIATHFEMGEPN